MLLKQQLVSVSCLCTVFLEKMGAYDLWKVGAGNSSCWLHNR